MTSNVTSTDLLGWTLVVAAGISGGLLLLNLMSLMRPPRRSTRHKPRLLRTITTRLDEAEVRRRLRELAATEQVRVVEATDPPRLVLVTPGRPYGRNGPGFRYPVYLTRTPEGTLVEIGAVRSVPAPASALEGPLDNVTEAVRARLAGEASQAHPLTSAPYDLFVDAHPRLTRPRPPPRKPVRQRLVAIGIGLALGVAGALSPFFDWFDDEAQPDELRWLTSVGVVERHSLIVSSPGGGASVAMADGSLDTWIGADGREHHDSWPRCLTDGTWRLRFAWFASDDAATVPTVAAVDCRELERIRVVKGPPRRRR